MMTILRFFFGALTLANLAGCVPERDAPAGPNPVSLVDEAAVEALAKTVLRDLQTPSFQENREYCGVIGLDQGVLRAAAPTRGRAKLCITFNVPETWQIVAIYHTHGAYDRNAHSEVPSVQDIESVYANRVLGYVSTLEGDSGLLVALPAMPS